MNHVTFSDKHGAFGLRWFLLLLSCVLVWNPALADDAEPAEERVPTISPDELRRGQRGYGLSVFAGHQVERFEVEVLGVQRRSTPGQDFIMARLTGQGLEHSGVAAGMSGSPVYFDGRLAGAVAYSYLFSKDAIAGITPIDSMRSLGAWPGVEERGGEASGDADGRSSRTSVMAPWLQELTPTWQQVVEQSFPRDSLAIGLDRLLGGSSEPSLQDVRPAVTWTASGFGPSARQLLASTLDGGLAPSWGMTGRSGADGSGSGGARADAVAPPLEPGSGMAVVLVEGDQSLAAHGTVTDMWGDQLVGFGHPMYGLGPVELPLATSEVITVLASVANSFKVSNAGALVGTLDQDRLTGVRGRLGPVPELTRLRVQVDGGGRTQHYEMGVAQLSLLRPLMSALAVLGALDAGHRTSGRQGIDLDAVFDLGVDGKLAVRQSFDGSDAALESVTFLLGYLIFLDLNAWQDVDLRSIDVTLRQVEEARVHTLMSAQPEVRRVRPGQRLPVLLELESWRGERQRKRIEVDIPDSLRPGPYWLMLGDGTSVDALELAIEKEEPTDFASALEAMGKLHSRRQLSVLGMRAAPGLTVDGRALPDLPTSMRSLFGGGQTTELESLRLVIDHRQHFDLDEPMNGALRIDLDVLPQRP